MPPAAAALRFARALVAGCYPARRIDSPLLLVNADADDTTFVLPEAAGGWQVLLDTAAVAARTTGTQPAPAAAVSPLRVRSRSLVLLAGATTP